MGWKLDIKSAVVGAAVVAATALFLGAAKSESVVGRYKIAAASNYAYVVDTMTGQVWSGAAQEATTNTVFFGPKTESSK